MRNCFLSFILLAICFSCTTKNDPVSITKQVELLHANAKKTSEDSSYIYLHSAKRLLDKNPNVADSLKAVNVYLLGHYFRNIQQTDSSLYYFKRATTYVKNSIQNSQEVDYFYFTFEAYEYQNEHGDALAVTDAFKSKINLSETSGYKAMLYFMYQDVYIKMEDYEAALPYNKLELEESKALDNSVYIPSVLYKKAKILYYIDRKEDAFRLLDSLVVAQDNYSSETNVEILNTLGIYKYYDGDYDEAINYYKKTLPFAKLKSDPARVTQDLSVIYSNIAEAYIELGQFKEAAIYLDSTKQLGIENSNSTVQKNYLNYKLRYAIATNTDAKAVVADLENLYEYQRKEYENKINKELVALTEANKVEQMLQKEKAQIDRKNSNLRNTLLWSGIGGLLLIFAAVLYYRYTRVKLEREHMKTQQRLLRAQMNPHFTFNTLSVISRMIDKSPVDAKNYLVKFSRLLGSIFENSTFDYVLLEKELDALRAYMDLQQLRFEKNFTYTIDVKDIESDLIYVPGMLLQPIVENSITHGFQGIDYLGELKISLHLKDNIVFCKIEDNGNGLNTKFKEGNRVSSTTLIAAYLEKVTKTSIRYENKSNISKTESGVVVSFPIPYKTTLND